jgi:hypothetical protein
MENTETWRVALEAPEYEVSSEGRVRRIGGKPLKPAPNTQGYLHVTLCTGGRRMTRTLHVLVATAFHGPRPEGLVAAHNNGNKRDNRAANLRWTTHLDNIHDKRRHGTVLRGDQHPARKKPETRPRGEKHGHAKLTASEVLAIRASTETQMRLAAQYGVSQTQISDIRLRKIWKHI